MAPLKKRTPVRKIRKGVPRASRARLETRRAVVGEEFMAFPTADVDAGAGKSPAAGSIDHGVGFGKRCLARILDIGYSMVLGLFAGFVFGIVYALGGWDHDLLSQKIHQFNLWSFLIGYLASLFYHMVMEGVFGATIGKLVCGIRVVGADGGFCGLGRALKRSFALLWDGFLFGAVAYEKMKTSRLNQRHGDVWANTLVVDLAQLPEGAREPSFAFWLALLLVTGIWCLLIMLALLVKLL